jgi:hypothetical protein
VHILVVLSNETEAARKVEKMKTLTLKVPTAVFVRTMEKFKLCMQLIHESQRYTFMYIFMYFFHLHNLLELKQTH